MKAPLLRGLFLAESDWQRVQNPKVSKSRYVHEDVCICLEAQRLYMQVGKHCLYARGLAQQIRALNLQPEFVAI